MAWPGKVEAKDLIGLSQEELATKLAEINTALTAAQAATTKVEAQELEMTGIKASLAALEGRVQQPVVVNNQSGNQNELPDWGDDANAAFRARINPLVGVTLNVQAELAFQKVAKRLYKQNSKYELLEADVEKFLSKQPLQARTNEEVIENAFKIVYADNIDQIQKDQNARSGKFFIESASNQGTPPKDESDPNKALSPAELKIATGMGISPETYLKSKQSITVSN